MTNHVVHHTLATLQGLSTIHAFHREKRFMQKFYQRLDYNTRSFFAFWYGSRW